METQSKTIKKLSPLWGEVIALFPPGTAAGGNLLKKKRVRKRRTEGKTDRDTAKAQTSQRDRQFEQSEEGKNQSKRQKTVSSEDNGGGGGDSSKKSRNEIWEARQAGRIKKMGQLSPEGKGDRKRKKHVKGEQVSAEGGAENKKAKKSKG